MTLPRRRLLQLAGAAGALSTLSRRAAAQSYPAKPLRWIVGFPAGGGADTVTRIMAPWLSERLGQPVTVENRPGASSNISIQTVVASPPDGYTLLFVAASATVNVTLFGNQRSARRQKDEGAARRAGRRAAAHDGCRLRQAHR